jgi:hypothetical protein
MKKLNVNIQPFELQAITCYPKRGEKRKLKGTIELPSEDCKSILIHPKGYGDKHSENGQGTPVMLELYEGRLRLIVWADINNPDATHIIDLEGARESNRKEG